MPVEHNEENRVEQPTYLPFDKMVSNLFSDNSFNATRAGLMHAAVGVMGEAVELAFATDTENFLEEAGDMEFYIEAMLQQVDLSDEVCATAITIARDEIVSMEEDASPEIHFNAILGLSADLLDIAKKLWVYHKPLDNDLRVKMASTIGMLKGSLLKLYSYEQVGREDVIDFNQEKLAKRYPNGVYSNQHAQARLDKQEG